MNEVETKFYQAHKDAVEKLIIIESQIESLEKKAVEAGINLPDVWQMTKVNVTLGDLIVYLG